MTTPIILEVKELESTLDELRAMDAIKQVLAHYDLPDDQMQRVLNWVVGKYTPPAPTITTSRRE